MVPGSLQRFALRVRLPDGWSAVSQGAAPGTEPGISDWSQEQPQDHIYPITAAFVPYANRADGIATQVGLRQPDPGLVAAI